MKLKITHTATEFRVEVLDDTGSVVIDEATGHLVNHRPYEFPTHFRYKDEWYAVMGPYYGLGDDWHIYKMQKIV
jgi:hypothetical protein